MRALGEPGVHPEGQFFPDTYRLRRAARPIWSCSRIAHRRMQDELRKAWAKRAPDLPLAGPYEALILASIVEKETALERERPQIAGVFVERLRRGMRLQTDPTVIYGMGVRPTTATSAAPTCRATRLTTRTRAPGCRRRRLRCRAWNRCRPQFNRTCPARYSSWRQARATAVITSRRRSLSTTLAVQRYLREIASADEARQVHHASKAARASASRRRSRHCATRWSRAGWKSS